MKHHKAVAAVIIHEGKILCVQKGDGKREYDSRKWEFPGGKVEKGETKKEAVVREIREELNMRITVESKFLVVDHRYPDMDITMHVYFCSCDDPQVTLLEHIAYEWLSSSELRALDWAAAEIPVVEKLIML